MQTVQRLTESPRSANPRFGPVARLAGVATLAAILLGWLAMHTDLLFADGLRYIAQAKAIERGALGEGIKTAVDHPAYPFAIATVHRVFGGDTPEAWQAEAQAVSIVAGLLLVVPLYLVSRELFGDATALPACALFFAVPLTGHVFADTLSESTFLLFWTWGLWGALRFVKTGVVSWLPVVLAGSALAYLTRPEGLLLPAALVTAVLLSPRWAIGRLRTSKALAVVLGIGVGSACLVGPYMVLKGGLATKPSVARLLGTAPRSAAHAVERQRPLDPGQSAAKTYAVAAKAVVKAVAEAVSWPLVPLAILGLASLRLDSDSARQWRLIGVIVAASALALIRLHATGGYCSARHAMILSLVAIPAAAFGLGRAIEAVVSYLGPRWRAVGWGLATAGLAALFVPSTFTHVNEGLEGYREAGHWLAANADETSLVVDLTGWSQFYGNRPSGYTFENVVAAQGDPRARWVVAREAHLKGPWEYCERLRKLVAGREPVKTFQGARARRSTKVFVFDRQSPIALSAAGAERPDRR